MASFFKSAGFLDGLAAASTGAAAGSGGLLSLRLWNAPESLLARVVLCLAVAILCGALTLLVICVVLAPRSYERARPFSPIFLSSLAGANLLLGTAALSSEIFPDLPLSTRALPFLAAVLLFWLSHPIQDMRRSCHFCEGPWRARVHLLAVGGLTVCDLCVEQASAVERPELDASIPRVACSFCGASLPGNQFPLQRGSAAMCHNCVGLAREVIAQGTR